MMQEALPNFARIFVSDHSTWVAVATVLGLIIDLVLAFGFLGSPSPNRNRDVKPDPRFL